MAKASVPEERAPVIKYLLDKDKDRIVGRLQIAKPALNCKAITLNELVLLLFFNIRYLIIIIVGILFWHEL